MEQVPYWGEDDNAIDAVDSSSKADDPGIERSPAGGGYLRREDIEQLTEEMQGIKADISSLNDLFVRRLLEDKQKNELIRMLDERSSFAVVEPFVNDLILLLDRVERVEGDFAASVVEEVLEMMRRRDIQRISVGRDFNPSFHKAVKVVDRSDADDGQIIGIVRNGYVFGEKVIRPAEVVLARHFDSSAGQVEGKVEEDE